MFASAQSRAAPVSNLYRHVLKVLAESSIIRRTIWVKAKMPGVHIISAFQLRLKKNSVTTRWITVSSSVGVAVLSLIQKMLKHGE